MNKEYIGDSVYVEMEEGRDLLSFTTENGDGFPTNTIYMDGQVLGNLILYLKKNVPNFWATVSR